MIVVLGEQRHGALSPGTWEAVAASQSLGQPVTAALAGSELEALGSELASAKLAEVLLVEHSALRTYTSDGFVAALAQVLEAERPAMVVFPHTYQTRDFAPALAARLGRPFVTDCTGFSQTADGWCVTRPVFQGKLNAVIQPLGPPPHLVTLQLGAFRGDAVERGSGPAPTRRVTPDLDEGAIRQRPEAPFQEARQAVDLSQAARIVAVGRGIKDAEHLDLVRSLATALGAEVAASRPICDAGWLPMDRQIGSSGQTVAPKLYLALGISGAIQHLVGMRGSKTIVAVNKDPDAPLFEVADYGIVGDLFEIVPAIIAALGE